jgi:hypothetical protein
VECFPEATLVPLQLSAAASSLAEQLLALQGRDDFVVERGRNREEVRKRERGS